MADPAPDQAQAALQRRSRRFALITAVLAAGLLAAIVSTFAYVAIFRPADVPELLILYALYWFPTLFYVWGLAAVSLIFVDVGRGALFGSAVGRGLRRLGIALIGGGAVNLLIIHVLHNAQVPTGFSDGTTRPFAGLEFDPAYVVLILVGFALLLLAQLLQLAETYRTRAAELEAELDAFL
jgi:hypothetical protein